MKRVIFRSFACGLPGGGLPAVPIRAPQIAEGPYLRGTSNSLGNIQCPDWFRDAKFGIWAHWGPQAVPMDGRLVCPQHVHEQGSEQYKHHLETTAIRPSSATRTSSRCGRPRGGIPSG